MEEASRPGHHWDWIDEDRLLGGHHVTGAEGGSSFLSGFSRFFWFSYECWGGK
jgi:hypothetical protein